jgi:hypothetical protein
MIYVLESSLSIVINQRRAMTQDEMREYTEHVLVAVTRYRAMASEELSDGAREVALKLQHWSMGNPSIIPMCEKMLAADAILPTDFYNLMFICTHLAPEVGIAVQVIREVELPEPRIEWLAAG